MGGYGVWELAAAYPNTFAALAPICGAGSPQDAPFLKHIPTWIFHGQDDPLVSVRHAHEMHDALTQLGAPPRLTIYPQTGHDSWTPTYTNPDLYTWLLARRRQPH
jgi:predicted peptidase